MSVAHQHAEPSVEPFTRSSIDLTDRHLLQRVVLALNASLELQDVLRLMGGVALEISGAARFSVFFLEGRRLHPAVAVAAETNRDLWGAFHGMGPIDLGSEQWEEKWQHVTSGRSFVVHDVREEGSGLLPPAWVETFAPRAVVLVPLRWKDGLCGLMCLEWDAVRSFEEGELRALEALGSSVGEAVGSARPFDTARRKARLQESLAQGAAALASPLQPPEIVERLSGAYVKLLEPKVCGVALVDAEQIEMTTVATHHAPAVDPIPLSEIPDRIVTMLGETWAAEKRPVEMGNDPWLAELLDGPRAGASWYLALPLLCDGHTRGGVLLGFDDATRLNAEEQAAAQALAAIGAAALERHALIEDIEEGARERAVSAERERFASDLHDTAGQLFVALGLFARRMAESMPADSPWTGQVLHFADLADRGKDEIDQAVTALAFLPVGTRGLELSLRALAESVAADSNLDVGVDLRGRPVPLPPTAERALFRVAHEALTNAWRHARCRAVTVTLDFGGGGEDEVVLRVADDGIGIGTRGEPGEGGEGTGLRLGILGMRRAMAEAGGTLELADADAGGTVVTATVAARTA